MDFETLTVRQEGAVLFVDIAAPPMNLLGPQAGPRIPVSLYSASRGRRLPSRCSCSRALTPTTLFLTST